MVRTGQPVIVEDAPSHPLLEGVQGHVAARGIHAIAALPLTLQGQGAGGAAAAGAARAAAQLRRARDRLARHRRARHRGRAPQRAAAGEHPRADRAREERAARRRGARRPAQALRVVLRPRLGRDRDPRREGGRALAQPRGRAAARGARRRTRRGQHVHQLTHPSDEGLLLAALVAVSGRARPSAISTSRCAPAAGGSSSLSLSAAPLEEGGARRSSRSATSPCSARSRRELRSDQGLPRAADRLARSTRSSPRT